MYLHSLGINNYVRIMLFCICLDFLATAKHLVYMKLKQFIESFNHVFLAFHIHWFVAKRDNIYFANSLLSRLKKSNLCKAQTKTAMYHPIWQCEKLGKQPLYFLAKTSAGNSKVTCLHQTCKQGCIEWQLTSPLPIHHIWMLHILACCLVSY